MLAGCAIPQPLPSMKLRFGAQQAVAAQVYNLPETVRESDVEKLSFAVQLADGFYATSQVRETHYV